MTLDPSLRIIKRLPLEELWRDDGFISTSRGKRLRADDIRDLLRAGRIQFVIADVGSKPRWIGLDDCYRFWKTEVKPHLAEPNQRTYLDSFPDSYCYTACEWGAAEAPIVVLEHHH